ncbi:MAG: putative papain-like cysteine peptidase [Variovorax sp.]|nr:putative papain-like cysteine peptidase [Variovorax sp.]
MFGHVVSVGGDCQPAHQIRRVTGHEEAHFFDWLQLRAEGVARLVEEDFDGFLGDARELALVREPYAYVCESRYGARLLHDLPLTDDFLAHAEVARQKYAFLAQRWRDLMDSGSAVLFVWCGDEGRDAIFRLAAALRRRREGRPFHLLALRSDLQEPGWLLPDVSNRFLRQPEPYAWTGDDAAWDAHFGRAASTKS